MRRLFAQAAVVVRTEVVARVPVANPIQVTRVPVIPLSGAKTVAARQAIPATVPTPARGPAPPVTSSTQRQLSSGTATSRTHRRTSTAREAAVPQAARVVRPGCARGPSRASHVRPKALSIAGRAVAPSGSPVQETPAGLPLHPSPPVTRPAETAVRGIVNRTRSALHPVCAVRSITRLPAERPAALP